MQFFLLKEILGMREIQGDISSYNHTGAHIARLNFIESHIRPNVLKAVSKRLDKSIYRFLNRRVVAFIEMAT